MTNDFFNINWLGQGAPKHLSNMILSNMCLWMCLWRRSRDRIGKLTKAECFVSPGCASSKPWRAWADWEEKSTLGCLSWNIALSKIFNLNQIIRSCWVSKKACCPWHWRIKLALLRLQTVAWSSPDLRTSQLSCSCSHVIQLGFFFFFLPPYSIYVLMHVSVYASIYRYIVVHICILKNMYNH